MAGKRRTLNRRDLRAENDAVEAREGDVVEGEEEEVEDEESSEEDVGEDVEADVEVEAEAEVVAKPKAKARAKKPKAPAKPKAPKAPSKRTRTAKVVRLKAVWVIKDNSAKIVETFEFNQKTEAEARLAEKQTDKKGAFYVEMQKVPLE